MPASRDAAAPASPPATQVVLHAGRDTTSPSTWSATPTSPSPAPSRTASCMERAPHQMLEGILIAAWATGSEKTFVYIRGEYASPGPGGAAGDRRGLRRGQGAGRRRAGERLPARRGADAGRRRLHLRRGDRAAGVARGQEGAAAQEAALPGPVRRLRHAHHGEQRRDLLPRAPHRRAGAPSGSAASAPTRARARRSSACRVTSSGPGSTSCRWARASTRSSSSTRRRARGPQGEGRDPRRGMSMPILPAGQLDVPMANEFLRERQTMLGTGGDHGDGRHHLHGRAALRDHLLLPGRVLRPVHPVPRRARAGWDKIVDRIERGAGERGRPR